MTVAFVFQGGSSLAAVQVGMLRALTEAGIRPDIVVGSSAGAINAVAFAQNPTGAGIDDLRRLWVGLRRSDVFPVSLRAVVTGLSGRGNSLVRPDRLRSLLEHTLRVSDLRDTAIPAHVVATDALAGRPEVLSEGSAVDALVASSSIPGLLPPVPWLGKSLIDGGVSADVPILQAEALGATTSYVLPSLVDSHAYAGAPITGALPIMLRSMGMLLERTSVHDLAAARGEVHVLPVPPLHGLNPLDFRRGAEYIRLGYDSARGWLSRHAALVAV
jgi:NTE family protein